MLGVIESLKAKKGADPARPTFGFIRSADGLSSYFFVASGLQQTTLKFDDLKEGLKVQFTPIDHPRGPRAIEIHVLAILERS